MAQPLSDRDKQFVIWRRNKAIADRERSERNREAREAERAQRPPGTEGLTTRQMQTATNQFGGDIRAALAHEIFRSDQQRPGLGLESLTGGDMNRANFLADERMSQLGIPSQITQPQMDERQALRGRIQQAQELGTPLSQLAERQAGILAQQNIADAQRAPLVQAIGEADRNIGEGQLFRAQAGETTALTPQQQALLAAQAAETQASAAEQAAQTQAMPMELRNRQNLANVLAREGAAGQVQRDLVTPDDFTQLETPAPVDPNKSRLTEAEINKLNAEASAVAGRVQNEAARQQITALQTFINANKPLPTEEPSQDYLSALDELRNIVQQLGGGGSQGGGAGRSGQTPSGIGFQVE